LILQSIGVSDSTSLDTSIERNRPWVRSDGDPLRLWACDGAIFLRGRAGETGREHAHACPCGARSARWRGPVFRN